LRENAKKIASRYAEDLVCGEQGITAEQLAGILYDLKAQGNK